jgi:hypothetical protein
MRFGLLVLLAFAMATPAVAAPADEAQDPPPPISGTPDFLFGRPRGSFGIRGSWIVSRASSDWYQFVTDQLTLKNSDFNQPAIGTEGGVSLTSRLDLVFGVDYGQSTTNSEYRRLVDNNRLPIEQTTLLRETNISAGVKYALTERGRQISRLAWVPRSFVPYVGAGGGAMWFQVRQTGDCRLRRPFCVHRRLRGLRVGAERARLRRRRYQTPEAHVSYARRTVRLGERRPRPDLGRFRSHRLVRL